MDSLLQSLVEGRTPAAAPQYFEQLCRAASRAELETMAAELEQFLPDVLQAADALNVSNRADAADPPPAAETPLAV